MDHGEPPAIVGALLESNAFHPSRSGRNHLRILADATASGTSCRVEILNRGKNGREYWIDTEVQPIHDAQGALTGFMEIGSDVTDRKRTERDLARERRTLANIIDGTDVGTWEWNFETGDARVNERWAQMLGYTRDELRPITVDSWRKLAHPLDRTQHGGSAMRLRIIRQSEGAEF